MPYLYDVDALGNDRSCLSKPIKKRFHRSTDDRYIDWVRNNARPCIYGAEDPEEP